MHERQPKCHFPGGFRPADIWESQCNPTTLLASQVLPSWALLSLNCMFVFMCWLLYLVSYNPIGADPKPHLKKKSNYFMPRVHSANKIDKQKLPVDLWRLRKKTMRTTSSVSDNGHNFYLIFPRECFSLEKPSNNSSHNHILNNTFLFVTRDDNCVGHFLKKKPTSRLFIVASSATFCCDLITRGLMRGYRRP